MLFRIVYSAATYRHYLEIKHDSIRKLLSGIILAHFDKQHIYKLFEIALSV